MGNYSGFAIVANCILCGGAEVVGPDHSQIALRVEQLSLAAA
jgi:hypothetical protein